MAVQQPAHRQPMGGQFPGHLGQQQRPLHHSQLGADQAGFFNFYRRGLGPRLSADGLPRSAPGGSVALASSSAAGEWPMSGSPYQTQPNTTTATPAVSSASWLT